MFKKGKKKGKIFENLSKNVQIFLFLFFFFFLLKKGKW